MQFIKTSILVSILLALSACATITPNFAVKQNFWSDRNQTVGVIIGDMPKPMAHKSGSQGLLDIAINNANAGDLEAHLAKLDISKIKNVKKKIAAYLKGKGLRVKLINEQVNIESLPEFEAKNDDSKKQYFGNRDYRTLKSKFGVDKLIVINVVRIGTIRNYYGFIPMGDPSGISHVAGYIVNLDNNQLEWKQVVTQTVPNPDTNWDTPPNFDGLTKAMYLAFDQSSNMLFNHFAQ